MKKCGGVAFSALAISTLPKYLKLDPKPSDLTTVRVITARTADRCKDIRRTVVS
jgi:hypothetical protein